MLTHCSLTLYAFHLLSDVDHQERRRDADSLWTNIANLSEYFFIPEIKNFKTLFIDEQNEDTRFLQLFPSSIKRIKRYSGEEKEVYCDIYPVRLHDTYAVDFTVFAKKESIELSELSLLNPDGCLLPSAIKASIGQTLLLYAKVEGDMPNKTLAETCAKAIAQTTDSFRISEGQLFGSPFFECEMQSNSSVHIIVWFDNHFETRKLSGKMNNVLMQLLCQRHKILYAFSAAKQEYKTARNIYQQLEQVKIPNKEHTKKEYLKKLEKILEDNRSPAVDYAKHLRNLSDHRTTVLTNRKNYGKFLDNIDKSTLPNDNLLMWKNFYEEKSEEIYQQIEIYLSYLSPAQPLFQQLIDTIQSLTHIETLTHEFDKQERLERLVVFIATILESTAISAKVDHLYRLPELFKEISHEGIFSTVLGEHFIAILPHLGIGLVFGIFAVSILWIYQKIRDR